MPLLDKLRTTSVNQAATDRSHGPVWKGPQVDGITQSLLSRFLVCRERFRLLAVEGLRPTEGFNHRLEYGQMWHTCEEALAKDSAIGWADSLKRYCQTLCKQYPTQLDPIEHWYNVCKVQFPLYIKFWAKHVDVVERIPIFQEKTFKVQYTIPSGRKVFLRGKWDAVDMIGTGKNAGIYLQENKTKGDINEPQMKRQLTFDLQTMLYLVALEFSKEQHDSVRGGAVEWARLGDNSHKLKIKGVRYNVIRRPLSGGKGSIVRKKGSKNVPPETKEEYYARLAKYIEDEPETYFMRWRVEVSQADMDRFRREFLDPVLEQLCNWWDWVKWTDRNPFESSHPTTDPQNIHWRHPFGVYNVLDEGGSSDLDEYIATGSTVGLTRVDNLFPEL